MSENKILHRVIRRIAGAAVWSFFSEVHIIGAENVPRDGPMIVCATHHNMILDPAVLSSTFPHRRIMNYWSKASLFKNPVLRKILLSSGNIPVERKSKDNRVLFKGTFDVLAEGEVVALFPEGTSYTEPRIMQVKDGASWSALEYTKWAKENPDKAVKKGVVVVPVGIVYTNKSKYRSEVILQFGEPISMDEYEQQFLSSDPQLVRTAVKGLTHRIESELIRFTINAPDWDTLFAARMARSLLWEKSKSISLDDFVPVSQTLVDLFSTPNATPNVVQVRKRLLEYYSLLHSSHLSNSALSALPLPRSLDPRRSEPLPSRLRTLLVLLKDSFAVLVRLPFFLFPLMVHMPAYLASRWAAKLVEDEEETQAQNKIVLGLLSLVLIYPTAFFFLWALFLYTPSGAIVAATIVWLFAVYHVKIIDDNYQHAKQLLAAWRVLVGVWAPRRWDLSMTALQQYLVPPTPPENPWIDKPKNGSPSSTPAPSASPSPAPPSPATPPASPSEKRSKKTRPPTRRIVRHVLRARVEAIRALSAFLRQLETAPTGKRVYASAHLAHQFGGGFSAPSSPNLLLNPVVSPSSSDALSAENSPAGVAQMQGFRYAREVLAFLSERGAKIATLVSEIEDDYWATRALSSDGEGDTDYTSDAAETSASKENEDLVWIAPAIQTHD